MMNYSNFKTVLKTASLGILVSLMIPITSFAQKGQYNKRGNKTKVVKRNNQNRVASARAVRTFHVPSSSRLINHRNTNYYYNQGTFYRRSNGSYIITRPPVGIRVSVLPSNPYSFRNYGRNYYYHSGTYYAPTNGREYQVVSAPIGAIVEYLPEGYDVVEFDGRIYYRYGDTFYRAIQEPNGQVIYEVVAV